MGFLSSSCSADVKEMGPTVDEIEIIEKDDAAEPEIGYDECLEMAGVHIGHPDR